MKREYLRKARKSKGITQGKMSILLGISQSSYANIEAGIRRKELTLNQAYVLAAILKISVDDIYQEERKLIA